MRLLKIDEVAERLGVSRWTAYRMAEAGEIPVVRLGEGGRGRAVRVPDELLDRWIEQRTENVKAPVVALAQRRAR